MYFFYLKRYYMRIKSRVLSHVIWIIFWMFGVSYLLVFMFITVNAQKISCLFASSLLYDRRKRTCGIMRFKLYHASSHLLKRHKVIAVGYCFLCFSFIWPNENNLLKKKVSSAFHASTWKAAGHMMVTYFIFCITKWPLLNQLIKKLQNSSEDDRV
jgi:hypothetical protein